MSLIYNAATHYTLAGLHVIPIRGDGSKKAAVPSWKTYQDRLAMNWELDEWFWERPDVGIGILGGNGLEILDINDEALIEPFLEAVRRKGPEILKIVTQVATPRPGLHIYIRSTQAAPSQTLARDEHGKTLIQIHGTGGYVVAPPSPACCHSNNQPYRKIGGSALEELRELSPERRGLLLEVARSFDRSPRCAPRAVPLRKVPDLSEAGEEPGAEPQSELAHGPYGLAHSFLDDRPWVYWHDRHFEYAGTRYRELEDYEVAALLARHIMTWSGTVPDDGRRPSLSRTLVSNTLQALTSLTLVRGEVPLPSLLPAGREANLLAFQNGLLDLDDGELRPHTPDWFSLVCLPYAYDPDAQCPQWLQILQQNLEGDAERIGLLQQFFGYVLLNSTDAQKLLFLVGEGANGKSVVLAGLHAMLGQDNVSTVPLEDFGGRFALARTLGKLANLCPEVGELDRAAEGTLKAFVSGDRMTFEQRGKGAFTARPTARLVLSTNRVPRFYDQSEGIWRRLLLVPFTRQIPVEERVAGLDKPEYWLGAGEVPGILNWALDGMRQLQANKMQFLEPAACQAALQAHRADSDPCRAFLTEGYVRDPQAKPLRTAELYAAYKDWCDANGHRPISASGLGRQVRRVFRLEESRPHRFAEGVGKAWFGLTRRDEAA